MRNGHQTTLRSRAILSGVGVHSNAPVKLTIHPCDAHSGICFLRTGLSGGNQRLIPANWSRVTMTQLCTVLGEGPEGSVATVEHLMAALAGLGIDNALIEVNGPEVPIMDGSAGDFVRAIDEAGVAHLSAPRRHLKIRKTVRVAHGASYCELRPAARGFRLEVEIDFASALIGRQKHVIDLDPARFRREIARARTFGFLSDVKQLWQAGFALGSSLDNSVALDGDRILNPEGLRFPNEFVRHKTLDAVGDLALAGAPIVGTYSSYRGGHKMNVAVLAELFADPDAYEFVSEGPRREGGRAELGLAAAAAFAPELN